MPTEKRWLDRNLFLGLAALLTVGVLNAATIEVESDDDLGAPPPTPMAQTAAPVAAAPSASPQAAPTAPAPSQSPAPAATAVPQPTSNSMPGSSVSTRRVRVSDNVGFYYFVKAGYVADPDSVPSVGQVVGSFDNNMNYSFAKKTFIKASSDKVRFSPGDLLVIYRTVQPVEESHVGPLGFQVENLAIVRVVETQTQLYQVEVVKSFEPFKEGDKVISYDNEIQRWKQAQIKKPLPSQPVTCYVAGGWGQGGQKTYDQEEYIYLSAGTKQGVVEGQKFRLVQVTDIGPMEEAPRTPVGEAQVIFAGSDSSTAQILKNNMPIEKSFEADYKP